MKEETAGKKKFDKKLLLLPLLPLLLIPLLAALLALRFLKGRKKQAAVKALARQLVRERKGGKTTGKTTGKAAGKRKVVAVVKQAPEPRAGVISQVKNLLSKRMVKFMLMAVAERIIASQRAKMKESLPPLPLSGRLSKAKDI